MPLDSADASEATPGPDAVRGSIIRRLELLRALDASPQARAIELELCRRDVVRWFSNFTWTYDPRAIASGNPAFMPFDLFPRQIEMVRFMEARLTAREDGLIEKSRDIGFTWVAGGFALHRWLFVSGFKTTFGSRKEEYVDRFGDPDSIFEKIRLLLYRLPWWMRPEGFKPAEHDNHMRWLHPTNENVIRGEAGDQMGRGGRSSLFLIDEAAFIERAERVDAATSANTDVRIWGSTVNGMGNLFARKRHGSMRPEQVFRFHYTDDPRKTPEWVVTKRANVEPHTWASEYDIDYAASVEGICIPAKWVQSAQRIANLVALEPLVKGVAGLDVGAGKSRSVFIARFGPVVHPPIAWGDPDTIETANRGIDAAQSAKATRADGKPCTVTLLRFDSVGVGAGVAAALARHKRAGITTSGVNVGEPPSDAVWPDGETSTEKFANLKAEAWFLMRERFKVTHETVLYLDGETGGHMHPLCDLIALPPDSHGADAAALASQLSLPKWSRNERGKIMLEKKDELARRGIASPDHAEALALTFAEGKRTAISAAERMRAQG